jgi:hypothetical protein
VQQTGPARPSANAACGSGRYAESRYWYARGREASSGESLACRPRVEQTNFRSRCYSQQDVALTDARSVGATFQERIALANDVLHNDLQNGCLKSFTVLDTVLDTARWTTGLQWDRRSETNRLRVNVVGEAGFFHDNLVSL